MMDKERLTLDIEASLHRKLEIAAARQGMSLDEISIMALEAYVRGEEADYLSAGDAPLLAELWSNDEDAIYDRLC